MAQATLKRTEFTPVTPVEPEDLGVENPTQVRYGWTPLDNIQLYSGSGTPEYFIQPVNSPFHREIPRNQLIPFETFTRTKWIPDENALVEPGRPTPRVSVTETITAYQAATELLKGYAARGYTMLKSLQGVPQKDAFRIFQLVQPFDYELLDTLLGELEFGVIERIQATEPIDLGEGYLLEPLRSERERDIATNLAAEMLTAAQQAYEFANEVLNDTEMDLVATASGRKEGKKGADKRDRRYEKRLGRTLPNMFKKEDPTQKLEQKVDYLVAGEARRQQEEIDRLRAENEQLRQSQNQMPPIVMATQAVTCDFVKDGDVPCKNKAETGLTRCRWHKDK